jgi:hypothetical protein
MPAWPAMVSVAPTLAYELAGGHDVNVDPDWSARWAAIVPVLARFLRQA